LFGSAKTEMMSTDVCRVFYECMGCGAMLRPKPADYCVFCSYGSVRRWPPGRDPEASSGATLQL
jgi:hypothetical protein